jgi:hypothetical protein
MKRQSQEYIDLKTGPESPIYRVKEQSERSDMFSMASETNDLPKIPR